MLEENILPYYRVVSLDPADSLEVARRMAIGEWRGGRIYDALHPRCAHKAGADWIYTFNVRHFQQMAPELEGKICAP
jgi:hypothetical protein